eukprot:196169_1
MGCWKCCERTKSVLYCLMQMIVASIAIVIITVLKPILYCVHKPWYNKSIENGITMAWLCSILIPDTFRKICNIINGSELMCGDTLPDVTMYDIKGNEMTILSLIDAGKFTILNFGNGCSSCIKYASSFYQLAQRYKYNEYVEFVYCYVKDEKKQLLQTHTITDK